MGTALNTPRPYPRIHANPRIHTTAHKENIMEINRPTSTTTRLDDTFRTETKPRQIVKTTFSIPIELHRRLKYYALTRDVAMNDLVCEWIEQNTGDIPA